MAQIVFAPFTSSNEVWNNFLRSPDGTKTKCKTCPDGKSILSTGGSTSPLRNHLRLVHKIILESKASENLPSGGGGPKTKYTTTRKVEHGENHSKDGQYGPHSFPTLYGIL